MITSFHVLADLHSCKTSTTHCLHKSLRIPVFTIVHNKAVTECYEGGVAHFIRISVAYYNSGCAPFCDGNSWIVRAIHFQGWESFYIDKTWVVAQIFIERVTALKPCL